MREVLLVALLLELFQDDVDLLVLSPDSSLGLLQLFISHKSRSKHFLQQSEVRICGFLFFLFLLSLLLLYDRSKELDVFEEIVFVTIDGKNLENGDHFVVRTIDKVMEKGCVGVLDVAKDGVFAQDFVLEIDDRLHICL